MEIKTIRSEIARNSFREMLDTALAGGATVIERYGKPAAVMLSYAQFEAMRKRHLAMLEEQSRRVDTGEYMTQEQIEADLRQRGLID